MKKVLLRYITCVTLRLQRQLALSCTLLVVRYSRQRPFWLFKNTTAQAINDDNQRNNQLIFRLCYL